MKKQENLGYQIDSSNLNTKFRNSSDARNLACSHIEAIKTEKVLTEWYLRTFLKRMSSSDPTHQPTILCAIHQLVMLHAHSSYEQLDYHIPWSPSLQHIHNWRLGSQTARQGVSPHSVGSVPVSFRMGLAGNTLVRDNCSGHQSICVGHFSRLVDMKDKHIVGGDVHRLPEHLDDPQKTLFLRGITVTQASIGLQARVSLADPLAWSPHVTWVSGGPSTE